MAVRERLLMDPQWRFHRGDFPHPKNGMHWAKSGHFNHPPIDPGFDDTRWQPVDLPHDFVVAGDFTRELTQDGGLPPAAGQSLHMMHGFLEGGVGWYRKTFFVPKSDLGRLVSLVFDGVFRDSMVWVNRHFLGRHASGYIGCRYDITDVLSYDAWNTVVVRADATEYEGWFYEGGGIYRHVWMEKTDRLRVSPDGAFVMCDVDLSGPQPRAGATVRTAVRNDTGADCTATIRSEIRDPVGNLVASAEQAVAVAASAEVQVDQKVDVPQPALWSLEEPALYRLASVVSRGGVETDRVETSFGIRKVEFDPDRGFLLNGRVVKLKGVCCHQDHAGVGSALPDRVQAYRVERLKEMGCNAYRCAHHPPTPELLDACDRLGMLVMDETRLLASTPDSLAQLDTMIRRDRNHPCVFIWSLGNEETMVQATEVGERIALTMKRRARQLDPTRLTTLAMNGGWGLGATHSVDVLGCNYLKMGDIDLFHRTFPNKPIVFTESASALGTRGVYARDDIRGYVSAYDTNAAAWGDTHEANWSHCDQRPFVAGTFIWTGFDYRGEPTPFYNWPCISSHFGIIDTCGYPKDVFYYYQSWWSDRDVVHVLPHWNWPGREGQEIAVWVYSNADEVELTLNGRSLGRKPIARAGHAEWKVAYAPGRIEAVGYRAGREIGRSASETTGAAAAVRLLPDRERIAGDGEDVSVVRVEIVDAQGRLVPDAGNEVVFEVSPNARIIGVGNGDPSSHQPDKGVVRGAFGGLAQVIVQSSRTAGPVTLRARSAGLREGVTQIHAEPATARPAVDGAGGSLGCLFEASALQPAPASLQAATPPPAGLAYTPTKPQASAPAFCDVREVHGGQDGMIYLRTTARVGSGGAGSLMFGSDGPVKVWVNGSEVACLPTATNPARPDEYSARVVWRPGENEIVFAMLSNRGKAWGAMARVVIG